MTTVTSQPGVVDGIVVESGVVYVPGFVRWAEPVGMRPANLKLGGDRVGEYHLANGRVVWAMWSPIDSQNTDVLVWDADRELVRLNNINRLQAARATERVLRELEEN